MTETTKTFLCNLREQRRARKLSQQELADALGTTRSHVSRIERGTVRVSLDQLHVIAAALSLSPTTLLRRVAA